MSILDYCLIFLKVDLSDVQYKNLIKLADIKIYFKTVNEYFKTVNV